MDRNVSAAQRLEDEETDANEQACGRAAAAAGFSSSRADDCDDGILSCPDCPWKHSADKWKPVGWAAYLAGGL